MSAYSDFIEAVSQATVGKWGEFRLPNANRVARWQDLLSWLARDQGFGLLAYNEWNTHDADGDIRHTSDVKAEYYYPPLDFIVYPKKDCFIRGPGGLPAYYESLAHELIHWSQARIGFEADYATCELLAEIGSCFWASKLGLPNLTNLTPRLAVWVQLSLLIHRASIRARKK